VLDKKKQLIEFGINEPEEMDDDDATTKKTNTDS